MQFKEQYKKVFQDEVFVYDKRELLKKMKEFVELQNSLDNNFFITFESRLKASALKEEIISILLEIKS